MHRLPLWVVGPLLLFTAATGIENAGVVAAIGVVLTLVLTVPLAASILRDPGVCAGCHVPFVSGDVVVQGGGVKLHKRCLRKGAELRSQKTVEIR